jgi:hypothetical protein
VEALHAIVYVSTAVRLLTPPELDELLAQARQRNAAAGVSGLLLYNDGNFMQYIEGPPGPLQEIYGSIERDPRHRGIIELMNEPVATREFEGWSMGFTPAQVEEMAQFAEAQWSTGPYTGTSKPSLTGRELLRNFWRARVK